MKVENPIASRRSPKDTSAITAAATSSSARCGTRWRDAPPPTPPAGPGGGPSPGWCAPTPASRVNSTPVTATVAPTRTSQSSPDAPETRTTSASGSGVAAKVAGPSTVRQTSARVDRSPAPAQRHRDRPGNGALRVAYLLPKGGDPGVPGEGEEQQPGRGQHAVRTGRLSLIHSRQRWPGESVPGHRHRAQGQQRDRDQYPGGPGGLVRRRAGSPASAPPPPPPPPAAPAAATGTCRCQRHGSAGGGLADHEPPAGQEPRPPAEPLPA